MQKATLIFQWKREEEQAFSGWDFSHVQDRYFEATPPWCYEEIVRQLLKNADSMLDMGTGGGEKLLEFKDSLPSIATATEGWPPNLRVARKNLEPYGIKVVQYDLEKESRMPFPDESFSIVINRHEAFDASEVARILKSGGVFLTQQCASVGDLSAAFGMEPPYADLTLAKCSAAVDQAGLRIEFSQESIDPMRFKDVGAIVYFAHACPWEVPADFSVERYSSQLLAMHASETLSFKMRNFIIQARKSSEH